MPVGTPVGWRVRTPRPPHQREPSRQASSPGPDTTPANAGGHSIARNGGSERTQVPSTFVAGAGNPRTTRGECLRDYTVASWFDSSTRFGSGDVSQPFVPPTKTTRRMPAGLHNHSVAGSIPAALRGVAQQVEQVTSRTTSPPGPLEGSSMEERRALIPQVEGSSPSPPATIATPADAGGTTVSRVRLPPPSRGRSSAGRACAVSPYPRRQGPRRRE